MFIAFLWMTGICLVIDILCPWMKQGNPDYESPECLDVPRLNEDLRKLFAGEEISIPIQHSLHGNPMKAVRTFR